MSKRNIPSLDGLRAISIALVLASHAGIEPRFQHEGVFRFFLNHLDVGSLGVTVFFVISGYLITSLLLRETRRTGTIHLGGFYFRRAMRIFPAYYVYLAVALLVSMRLGPHISAGPFLSAFGYFSNYYPYRLSHPEFNGWRIGQTWSLSLEEQFYCLWPAFLLFFPKRLMMRSCIGIVAVAAILRCLTSRFTPSMNFDEQTYRMFHTGIDMILTGSLIAFVRNDVRWRELCIWIERPGPCVASFIYILCSTVINARTPWWFHPLFGVPLTCVSIGCIVMFVTARPHTLIGRFLNLSWLRHIGKISYSLYLWQQMFLGPFHFLTFPWSIAAALCCAEASYWLVELPALNLRARMMDSTATVKI
jgi:peptidoglycan/LPS O-acetylase OafA/YrhL